MSDELGSKTLEMINNARFIGELLTIQRVIQLEKAEQKPYTQDVEFMGALRVAWKERYQILEQSEANQETVSG